MKTSARSSHRKCKRPNEFPVEVVARLCCKGDAFGSESKLQVHSFPRGLALLQCLCCWNGDCWELCLPSVVLQQCNPIFNQFRFQKYFIAQCESHCTDPESKRMYLAPLQKSQTFFYRKKDGEIQVKERMKILCQTFLPFQKVIKLQGSLGSFVQWWFFLLFSFFR